MSKPQLSLKATVTRRQTAPVPPDMNERLEQLRHHQAVENAAVTEQDAATATAEPSSGKQVKREAHALQHQFLSAYLGKPVTVYLINGVKLVGKLREYDQFTLLLQGPDGIDTLVFKHSISTIVPISR